jgi:hypothetical protein
LEIAVEESVRLTSAAVLIRMSSQWPTARRTVQALLGSGATVKIFLIGFAPMTADHPMPDCPDLECYADTRQPNMVDLPMDVIAALLKQCDLVVPV